MNLLLRIDRLTKKLEIERSKRIKSDAINKQLSYKLNTLEKAFLDKEPVDISTTIYAIHELRKEHRKIDIYHVAMISYALSEGKFTSQQFRNRFSSGKNKFYEVMLDMREWGYIDTVNISYKRRRVFFYLTTKGVALADKLNKAIATAKIESKKRTISDGKKK